MVVLSALKLKQEVGKKEILDVGDGDHAGLLPNKLNYITLLPLKPIISALSSHDPGSSGRHANFSST